MEQINYIDFVVLCVWLYHLYVGIQVGVWWPMARFAAFFGGIVIGFIGYPAFSTFIENSLGYLPLIADIIAFVLIMLIVQWIIVKLLYVLILLLPKSLIDNWLSKALSIFPATIDAALMVAAILLVSIVLPISPQFKQDVMRSYSGNILVRHAVELEQIVANSIGKELQETLTFLTVRPDTHETVSLPYAPVSIEVDDQAEWQMLELVNLERAKVGAPSLEMDENVVEVARAHSRDMWERQYFSHTNPDGYSPFDRMNEAGVIYLTAGENLALAPTVELAHQGLMNSPGHRRNILDPNFHKIGIGAISGGIYGKMFTQNFTD